MNTMTHFSLTTIHKIRTACGCNRESRNLIQAYLGKRLFCVVNKSLCVYFEIIHLTVIMFAVYIGIEANRYIIGYNLITAFKSFTNPLIFVGISSGYTYRGIGDLVVKSIHNGCVFNHSCILFLKIIIWKIIRIYKLFPKYHIFLCSFKIIIIYFHFNRAPNKNIPLLSQNPPHNI